MREHERKGAKMIADFLQDLDAPRKLVEDVSNLIEKHEEGGSYRQDVLKDADSLSFLETKVDEFVRKAGVKVREKDVREKFDYMYERISIEKAKNKAEPLYKKAIRKLEKK